MKLIINIRKVIYTNNIISQKYFAANHLSVLQQNGHEVCSKVVEWFAAKRLNSLQQRKNGPTAYSE